MAADKMQHQQLSYDSCCRLCLTDNTTDLKDVFGRDKASAGLVKRIAATLGVKIEASDKLTKSVCSQCFQKIQNWHTYRKFCVANQTKLNNWIIFSCTDVQIKEEPLDDQEESDIEIVESSEDSQTQFFSGQRRTLIRHQNGHQNEDDLPPSLSPNHPVDDNSMDNNSMDTSNAPNLNKNEDINGPLDSSTCTVCFKKFHNPRNKQRHERNVHGIEVNSTNTSQDAGNTTPTNELSAKTTSESSKIEFAAGLCLQSKSMSVSPLNKTPSEITLTSIEESYINKCKVIISVFNSNLCYCHNLVYPDHKRMITHLRTSSSWFPPFTCYNCLITFNGRSGKMKHFALCTKLRMENLIRLSELRGRDDNKIRLYHNYKCTQCNCVFAFFEDFCDHIYYDHLESDTQNLCTICETQFENFDQFKNHAFNNCYVAHYCDICYIQFASTEEFTTHCLEKHDNDSQFNFFDVVQNYNVLSNIEIANLLLTARNEANEGKLEPVEQQEVSLTTETVATKEKTALDEFVTHSPTACISCENSYSSYHNMIRHLKTAHKFTSLMMQNPLVCPDCGETHGNLYLLVKHRKNHPETNNEASNGHTCLTCNEPFETSVDLRKHIISTHAALLNNIVTEDSNLQNLPLKRKRSKSIGCLKCDECDESFGRASELESHRNSHLNFKIYRDSKTTYRSSLSNDKADFTCEVCNINFCSKQKLNQHNKTHHNLEEMPQLDAEEDVKPLICKFCTAAFTKQRELYDHIDKQHNNSTNNEVTYPRDCIFCSKTISKAGAYANHILMHKRLIADVDFVNNSAAEDRIQPEQKQNNKIDSNDDESDYHTCKRCFKVFTNRYTLKNHMKLHGITMKTPTRTSVKGLNKSTKLYWCNICHQGCQGEVEFKRHKLEHLAETNDQSTMPSLLVETDLAAEEDKLKPLVFSCDICTHYFPTKLALRKHKEKHLNEAPPEVILQKTSFYCKYCKISFSNTNILNEHMASVHEEGPPRKKLKRNAQHQLYSCSICKKTFSTVGALQSHQGWHKRTKGGKYSSKYMITAPIQPKPIDNNFFCTSCQIGFEDDTSLQLHTLEVHRNVNATVIPQQLITCGFCNLQFATKHDLETHVAVHAQEQVERKPHPCQFCDKCFSRGDTLAAHEKQYHADLVQNREYKCHLCDRLFDRNNSLAIHLKMHAKNIKPVQSQVKVYSCSICQIRFYLPKDLRNHIITMHPF